MTLLEYALAQGAAGFKVFPIAPRGKRPLFKGWQDEATSDASVIREWWSRWPEANIGIACGDDVVVLDVDLDKGGQASFDELVAAHGYPTTRAHRTGSGNLHFLFLALEDTPLRNAVNALPGVDVRAVGGLIVAPGSIHAKGGQYRVENDAPMEPCPDWLVELAGPQSTPPQVSATDVAPECGLEVKGVLSRRARELFDNPPAHGWNAELYFAAKDAQQQGYTADEFVAEFGPRTPLGFFDGSDWATIRSAYSKPARHPPRYHVEEKFLVTRRPLPDSFFKEVDDDE